MERWAQKGDFIVALSKGRMNRYLAGGTAVIALAVPLFASSLGSAQTPTSRTFPETKKTVKNKFLQYWDTHGGLPQQGFPISEEMQEKSDTDGKTYTVQYFERAVFELHPENAGTQYEVLLSLLGRFEYQKRYPRGAANQEPNTTAGSVLYPQTGKRLGGRFKQYWEQHGGLPQQGYPISDEFTEFSALNGKPYRVQYFERAVFEYHPENAGTPYDVLLSQLGTFRYREKYEKPVIPTPVPTAIGGGPPTPVPTGPVIPTPVPSRAP
jgi:hypothetical protein